MPPQYNRIPEIVQVPEDTASFVEVVNTTIRQINEVFAELNLSDSEFRGNDGFIPTYNNNVNLQENRLRNIARSQESGDAVTRRELEEIGLLGNPDGVVFNQSVTFGAGASSIPSAGGGSEIPSIGDVIQLIEDIVAGAIPVAFAGQTVTVQEYGLLGTTEGTLILGRNGNGKAEFAEIRNGRVQVDATDIVPLLELIYNELEKLNYAVSTNRRGVRAAGRRYNQIGGSDNLD